MRANPPDIAVLDIKMPRMDGLEPFEKLRMETDVPVIFLTSKDDEEDEASVCGSARMITSRNRFRKNC